MKTGDQPALTPLPRPTFNQVTDTLRRLILELGPHLDAIEAGEDRWQRVDHIVGTMINAVDDRPGTADCCDTGHGATLTFRGGGTCLPDDLASIDESEGFVWDHANGVEVPRDPIVSDLKVGDEILPGVKYSQLPTRDPIGSDFKVGDRVTVRKLHFHQLPFCNDQPMRDTEGKTGEVVALGLSGNPYVRIDGKEWYYHPSSLEHARDPIGSKSTRDPIGLEKDQALGGHEAKASWWKRA